MASGADGLCNVGLGCGCGKKDLFTCGEIVGECHLAKQVLIKDHCALDDCEGCVYDGCYGYLESCMSDAKMYVPCGDNGVE